ncbi:hypothetical protein E5221_26805 [Pseudomonas sp. A2]|nr:hypothetical protein E5221_26805 [Pseudomonas sp. A2]
MPAPPGVAPVAGRAAQGYRGAPAEVIPHLSEPVPASSRVNPLPQVHREPASQQRSCGSGFTREEAGTGEHHPHWP